jgi:signal transduction histidine kinase
MRSRCPASDIQERKQQLSLGWEAKETQIRGDVLRLEQVFWNLLKNASKFTSENGIIEVKSRNDPGWVVVTVSDSGIGFSPDAAGKLFDPFQQGGAEVTRQYGGLGLGLAIAKATIEGHGGTIRAESPGTGKGAKITVTLPLSNGATPGELVVRSPEQTLGEHPKRRKRAKRPS